MTRSTRHLRIFSSNVKKLDKKQMVLSSQKYVIVSLYKLSPNFHRRKKSVINSVGSSLNDQQHMHPAPSALVLVEYCSSHRGPSPDQDAIQGLCLRDTAYIFHISEDRYASTCTCTPKCMFARRGRVILRGRAGQGRVRVDLSIALIISNLI